MKISEILSSRNVTVSCELFPPKAGTSLEGARETVRKIAALNPSFMSVTYGAGGGTHAHTIDIADEIQNKNGVTALAHLTCVTSDRDSIAETLRQLSSLGISNILALRGDLPEGSYSAGSFSHAFELMSEIRSFGGFCIGGACYPEGHPEASSLEKDIDYLKLKVDNGCDFFTTQMFFDNNILYNFMFRMLKKGVDVPVIAGIMPVTNARQITRICSISGTLLPPRFKAIVDKFSHSPAAMCQAGIAYATEQIIDLIANGVNNIHIDTMNKPDIAAGIMNNLSEIFK